VLRASRSPRFGRPDFATIRRGVFDQFPGGLNRESRPVAEVGFGARTSARYSGSRVTDKNLQGVGSLGIGRGHLSRHVESRLTGYNLHDIGAIVSRLLAAASSSLGAETSFALSSERGTKERFILDSERQCELLIQRRAYRLRALVAAGRPALHPQRTSGARWIQ